MCARRPAVVPALAEPIVAALAPLVCAPTAREIAVDEDGLRIALTTQAADLRRDAFMTTLELLELGAGGAVTRWAHERHGTHGLRFAPSGDRIAFLVGAADGRQSIRVASVQSGASRSVADGLDAPVALTWARDGRALFVASTRPRADDEIIVATTIPQRLPWSRSSGEVRRIPVDHAAPTRVVCRVAGELEHLAASPDGRWLAFAQPECRDGLTEDHVLRRLDVTAGAEAPPVPLATPVLGSLLFAPSGRHLAYVGGRRPHDGRARPVNRYDTRVCVVDLDDGRSWLLSAGAPLCAGIPAGLAPTQQEIFWHDDERLTFVATCGHATALATQSIHDDAGLTVTALGRGASRSHAFSRDGSCVLLHSDRGAPFVAARWTRARGLRTLRRPALNTPAVPRPQPLTDVPMPGAWLGVPGDASTAPHPLVVAVYGGATPLQLAYDETQQALLARGYAVLVVNPSGCAGYGPKIADRHVGELGHRSVAEIAETLRLVLARRADLDGRRVGIYGGSFGGFMVMRALADSNRFSAGVSLAGFGNLSSYWAGSRSGYEYGLSALDNATPWSSPDVFVGRSPLFNADRISTPLLLVHGECDGVVPAEESHQMFVALRTLGRPATLVVLPNEDHPMRSRPSARIAHQRYLLAWFDRFLRDDPREWESIADGISLGPPPLTATA